MKITELIKRCRAGSQNLWSSTSGYKCDLDHGMAIAYDHSADMLEETVREIQEELDEFEADAKNGELSGSMRANAEAVAMILKWVLGENQE